MGEYIKEKIPRAHTLEEEKRKLDEEQEQEQGELETERKRQYLSKPIPVDLTQVTYLVT